MPHMIYASLYVFFVLVGRARGKLALLIPGGDSCLTQVNLSGNVCGDLDMAVSTAIKHAQSQAEPTLFKIRSGGSGPLPKTKAREGRLGRIDFLSQCFSVRF